MIRSLNEEVSTFERTEQRLKEWGASARESAAALELPRISGIAMMIAHVQREDDLELERAARRKTLRNAVRKAHKAWKEGDPPIDAKLVAEGLGYTKKDLSARGKEKKRHQLAAVQFGSADMQVDAVVAKLPNWAQICIHRTYRFDQPDRIAAKEIKMRVEEYASRRRAAVDQVAEKLAQRYSGCIESRKRSTARQG